MARANPEATRANRVYLSLPAELVKLARTTAGARGDVLSDFVHGAVITATKAAKAGHREQLPQVEPTKRPRGKLVSFRYTAPADEADECERVLAANGSSMDLVAEQALLAYEAAHGSRVDAVTPGEPHWVPRAFQAA